MCRARIKGSDSVEFCVQASAVLACRELGFEDGAFLDALDSGGTSAGPLPPWLSTEQLACDSDADTLVECANASFGNTALCGPIQMLVCTSSPGMLPYCIPKLSPWYPLH